MKKIIPRHSLLLTIGTSKPDLDVVAAMFAPHEVVCIETISMMLTGGLSPSIMVDHIRNHITSVIKTKLALGERVLVKDFHQTRDDRLRYANLAVAVGAPVFYLLTENRDWNLLRGDGFAEVIDMRYAKLSLVNKHITLDDIRNNYNGITVMGDVHGMHQTLLSALTWARSRNHYIIFVGDIIDYGPGTLSVMDEVYQMVMRGSAALVLGNHERKIFRWLDTSGANNRVRLSDGNRVTTDAIEILDAVSRSKWTGKMTALVAHSHIILNYDTVTIAHAAIASGYWLGNSDYLEKTALFGEFRVENNSPVYTYGWINDIPMGETVIVGHQIMSRKSPTVRTNANNGSAIFLDTGCGKGGQLSTVDIRFDDRGGLKVENFNMF